MLNQPWTSVSGREGSPDFDSHSESMTVAVGLSPREESAKTARRRATTEELDCHFGSRVARRRALAPPILPRAEVRAYPHPVAPRALEKLDTAVPSSC